MAPEKAAEGFVPPPGILIVSTLIFLGLVFIKTKFSDEVKTFIDTVFY